MKPSLIKPRHFYCNRGKGTVLRFVLSIDKNFTPPAWFSMEPRPNEPGVKYIDSKGKGGVLYLKSFASWCGACVGRESEDSFVIGGGVDFDTSKLEAFKNL